MHLGCGDNAHTFQLTFPASVAPATQKYPKIFLMSRISYGVERDSVVQYLGVKYAHLEHGFANATICEYESLDSIHATHRG